MKRARLLFIGFLLCLSSYGQDTLTCNPNYLEDDLLNKLTGEWNLTGMTGKNSFSVSWILNHQFLEVNFVDLASPPGYFAKVLIGYDCISEK